MKMFSIKSDFSTLICETSGKVVAVFIAKSGYRISGGSFTLEKFLRLVQIEHALKILATSPECFSSIWLLSIEYWPVKIQYILVTWPVLVVSETRFQISRKQSKNSPWQGNLIIE